MAESDGALIDIDELGIDILEALIEHGGDATSTEIRKYLGIDSSTRFNYRVREYLAPEGLIETHQPEPEPGKYPPKEIALTSHGQEYLDSLGTEGKSGGIADRLDRLEEQVDGLRKENKELRDENQELKELIEQSNIELVTGRVQELTDDVDDLQLTIEGLQTAFGEIQTKPVLSHSNIETMINTGFLMGNVSVVLQSGLDFAAGTLN